MKRKKVKIQKSWRKKYSIILEYIWKFITVIENISELKL